MTFQIRRWCRRELRPNYVGVTCSTLEEILPIYTS